MSKALSTGDVVSAILKEVKPRGVLSCRDALRKIRSRGQCSELTDDELVDLVIQIALSRHVQAIVFDHKWPKAYRPVRPSQLQ